MSEIDEAWHYPPELVSLLIDAVPRLVKGKMDQLNVFRGAGVAERYCGAPELHAAICVRRGFSSYSIGVSPPSAECGRSVL